MRSVEHTPEELYAVRLREAMLTLGRVFCLRDPLSNALSADLTPPQIHTVVALGHETTLSMGELGRRLSASGPTVTGIVDRLQKLELVERQRDTHDRRVVRLVLTDKGRAAHQELESLLHHRLAGLLSLLEDQDKEALACIFEKIAARAVSAASTETTRSRANGQG